MKALHTLLTWINGLLYLTVIATWIALPENLTLNLSGSLAAISLSLILLFQKRQMILSYLKSTQAQTLFSFSLNVFIVACCMGLINYLAYKHPHVIDLSRAKLNTLSSQSQAVVKSLDDKVIITLFERPQDRSKWHPLLELYRQNNPNIKWKIVDPDLRPDLIKAKGLTQATGLLLEMGEKSALATNAEEALITTAMLKIMRPKTPHVVFLQGHGEKDPLGVGPETISELKNQIEAHAFNFGTLEITTKIEVPPNVDVLVLWGPQNSLFDNEIKALDQFVGRGGNLIIAVDPQFQVDPHSNLRGLIEKWGIVVSNDLVLDQVGHVAGGQASVPLIKKFSKSHPVTKNMNGQVFFPLTASVERAKQNSEQVTILAQTLNFPSAWAERNMKEVAKGQMSFHPDLDKKGPVGVMAVREFSKGNKLAVFGNSTFVTDQYVTYGGNQTLFLNLLEWVVGEDKFISDGAVSETWQPLLLGETEIGLLFYASVVFIPLIMAALAFWRFRRSVAG